MRFLLPRPEGEWVRWVLSFYPQWVSWNNDVSEETERTRTVHTAHGLAFTLLSGAQAAAIVRKKTGFLYACSSDPTGGGGGSGFYVWDGAVWSKFA